MVSLTLVRNPGEVTSTECHDETPPAIRSLKLASGYKLRGEDVVEGQSPSDFAV